MPQRMGAFVGTLSGFSCKCLMMMVVVMMMMTGMMSVTTTMTCVYSCSVSMHHALFDVFSVHALCIMWCVPWRDTDQCCMLQDYMSCLLVFASAIASLSAGVSGYIEPAYIGLCITYSLMVSLCLSLSMVCICLVSPPPTPHPLPCPDITVMVGWVQNHFSPPPTPLTLI